MSGRSLESGAPAPAPTGPGGGFASTAWRALRPSRRPATCGRPLVLDLGHQDGRCWRLLDLGSRNRGGRAAAARQKRLGRRRGPGRGWRWLAVARRRDKARLAGPIASEKGSGAQRRRQGRTQHFAAPPGFLLHSLVPCVGPRAHVAFASVCIHAARYQARFPSRFPFRDCLAFRRMSLYEGVDITRRTAAADPFRVAGGDGERAWTSWQPTGTGRG